MAWAKFPSAWARVKKIELASSGLIKEDVLSGPQGLSSIGWRQDGSAGTAALVVLLALSIISNQQGSSLRQDNVVLATYDDLQEITGLSRATLSRALKLLNKLQVITKTRSGNACLYALNGIEINGGYCVIPQSYLLDGTNYLKRLKGILETIRRPVSLYGMKLYILLLVFRDQRSNLTRISYDTITTYTGMRREDISLGWQVLIAGRLAYLAEDNSDEVMLRIGEYRHNKYRINGLKLNPRNTQKTITSIDQF